MPSPAERLRQCAEPHIPMLKDLSQSSKRRARLLMQIAPDNFLRFMTNAAHNVLKGNLDLDPSTYKYLRKKRQKMVREGWVKSKKERKKNLRQYGGSLGRDLSKVMLSALQCPDQDHTAAAAPNSPTESTSPTSSSPN